MKLQHLSAALLAAAFLFNPGTARAAEDHGHDHGPAPTTAGPALPRFAAVSDLFELVGVLDGQRITLYLDRAADNSPVSDAQIEIDIGGQKFKASRHGNDEFEVMLPQAPKPGLLPITATVSAGADTDLLAGELDVHEDVHADEAAPAPWWKAYTAWAAGGIAALVLLVLAGRAWSARAARVGGAA
jgi:hypothetical protein